MKLVYIISDKTVGEVIETTTKQTFVYELTQRIYQGHVCETGMGKPRED